ncbi:MAG: PEGA domain-containing protein [Patescibacteria group bacterium]|jgi:hypothetical protein|nr:PEGA domain-containing protein [Patescibacteria group bacterium]
MTNKKKFIILIAICCVILTAIIFITTFWLRTTIEISPSPDKITVGNHSTSKNPFRGYLFAGKYTLTAEKDGYPNLTKQIQVKSGKTKYSFTMPTYEEVFIESLPINTTDWHIDYSHEDNLYYIEILNPPYQENLAKAKAFIKSKGVDINKIKIYSWKPAQME